jgi:hypothetical protein
VCVCVWGGGDGESRESRYDNGEVTCDGMCWTVRVRNEREGMSLQGLTSPRRECGGRWT